MTGKKTKTSTFFTAILGIIGIGVLVVAWSLYSALAERTAPRAPLNYDQKVLLASSLEQICQIDAALCNRIDLSAIDQYVVQLPRILDLGKPLYLSHRGEALHEGDEFRIEISRHVYESGQTALAVFMYHELRHVADSPLTLYDMAADAVEVCVDHNRVKSVTKEFAAKYDRAFPDPSERAEFYANLYGNTLKDC